MVDKIILILLMETDFNMMKNILIGSRIIKRIKLCKNHQQEFREVEGLQCR